MISYVRGDATNPLGKEPKCIFHIVNDIGKWGKGFVVALSKKWPETRREYLKWYNNHGPDFRLGAVLYQQVEPGIWVTHMVAQSGIRTGSKGPPIRYVALDECLLELGEMARGKGWSLHAPRIGTGLAGGKWPMVEMILVKRLEGIPVTVYDYD